MSSLLGSGVKNGGKGINLYFNEVSCHNSFADAEKLLSSLFFFFFFWLHLEACGIVAPNQGPNLCPLHWKHGAFTTAEQVPHHPFTDEKY